MKLIIAWIKEQYLLADADFYFVVREVLQFGGGKIWRRNEQQQHVWPASLTSQRIPHWECKIFNLFENSMYFFEISQTLKCLDLHCLRQKTVTQSDKGLAKIAEGASPRRHAETSPVKFKDTHLTNNKLPPAEILCGDWVSF